MLSTVGSLIGTTDENNLLIISQESRMLLEVSRTGEILSSFNLLNLSGNAEGVTIDADGNIYVVAETNVNGGGSTMFVLAPNAVPVPAALPLLGSALGSLCLLGRRRRKV